MTTETYEILAIKYGEFAARKRFESFIAADDHDGPHPIDYFVWVIRNANRTILVDCGFDEAEGAKRGRKIARTPAAALEMIGVPAGNLEQLIVSHLHYDHAGTMSAFPKARFHLQAAEMAYATGPCMCHNHIRYPFTRRPRVRDGAQRLLGPRRVPRRRRGGRAGRHRAQDRRPQPRPAVRAGDDGGRSSRARLRQLALLRELREGQSLPHHARHRRRAATATRKLKKLAASPRHIVPGHDPLVLQRYPALNSQTKGIVHRLDVARLDG